MDKAKGLFRGNLQYCPEESKFQKRNFAPEVNTEIYLSKLNLKLKIGREKGKDG